MRDADIKVGVDIELRDRVATHFLTISVPVRHGRPPKREESAPVIPGRRDELERWLTFWPAQVARQVLRTYDRMTRG